MASKQEYPEFFPKSRKQLREWFIANHESANSTWIFFYKKDSGKMDLTYDEAVKEALCFGWVDSVINGVDDESYKLLFSPRKHKSMWSALNKKYVAELEDKGLMTDAGRAKIKEAKANGMWEFLDDIDKLIEPDDLKAELDADKKARTGYDKLSDSKKKIALTQIKLAKTEATRNKRINAVVDAARKGKSAY